MESLKLRIIMALLLLSGVAEAQYVKYQNWCENGGVQVITQGLASANYVQNSYPACTVTVYLHGTFSTASLYSDAGTTPLTNPFTANALSSATPGAYGFYVIAGEYDIVLSNGGFPSPITLFDVFIGGIGGGGGGGVSQVTVNSSTLAPLYSAVFNAPTTTPNLVFTLLPQSALTVFGNPTNSLAALRSSSRQPQS